MILTVDTLTPTGYIVTVLGSLISFLLIIIGFFLRSLISEIRETRDSVIELTANFTNQDRRCSSAHKIIDERLNAHSAMINRHETDIAILKEKS